MSYISAIRKNDNVLVWERTEKGRELKRYDAPYYFFIEDDEGEYTSIYGHRLKKYTFKTGKGFRDAKDFCNSQGIRMFESDIGPELKILSEHYYQKEPPKLHVTYLDIEVDYNPEIGFAGVQNPYAPINAIAMYHDWENRMVLYAVPPPGQENDWTEERLRKEMNDVEPLPTDVQVDVVICENEKELLYYTIGEIEDSDVLLGWNSLFFDLPYIGKRVQGVLGKKYFNKLSFPHAGEPRFRDVEMFGSVNVTIDFGGRLASDYLDIFKNYEMAERPSYKLEAIADELLPDMRKLEYTGTLHKLYRENFAWFCRYNLRDTEVLKGFEENRGYVALANFMYHLSTSHFRNVTGTIRLAELAINNYCIHEKNQRVPDSVEAEGSRFAGATVLEPKIGMHRWIGSIDITSLYPSAIRANNISPEKLMGQFHETVDAVIPIKNETDENLRFQLEENGKTITKTAKEWKRILKEQGWGISGFGTVFLQDEPGIIPSILKDWFDTRKHYQKLKKEAAKAGDSDKAAYYDRMQYIYKLKLNSLYGALGNAHFRFYDLRMSESTTGTGRLILLHQSAETNRVMTDLYDHEGEAVLYGDTDSTYFNLWADNKEDAIKIADYVAGKVNDTFQKYMQETFLCQPGFDDIINANREMVASRGIFVEKKRYILRIVDDEGKEVDKLKVMGLDTKKTTMPKPVGKKINEFVGRLLRGEDDEWEVLKKDIVAYKDELKNSSIMEIGLPKGVKNVEKYTNNWNMDPKTKLPGHVAASIFYNKCLDDYNDHESPRITSGMKIKVFYLTRTYGRFHSIALPTDIEIIPKWFSEYEIDMKKHIDRLVDKPMNNILKAIDKLTPSQQSLYIDDLFGF